MSRTAVSAFVHDTGVSRCSPPCRGTRRSFTAWMNFGLLTFLPGHACVVSGSKCNQKRNGSQFLSGKQEEHMMEGKVLYNKKDIRSVDGLREFRDDCDTAYSYIAKRVHGIWKV